tara:strand:- start:671 stop:1168 length:498 start_codon:yes stop_codon:yes gene_type:complete
MNTVEITDFKNNQDLQNAARAAWPNVTLRGKDIIEFIGEQVAKIEGRLVDDQEFAPYMGCRETVRYDEVQECYGGYDTATETYYIGFETWSTVTFDEDHPILDEDDELEEDVSGYILLAISKEGEVTEAAENHNTYRGLFYGGTNGNGNGFAVADRMGLAHLRLD